MLTVSLNQVHLPDVQQGKQYDANVYSREGVSSQGRQAWRWENKSQIHLPKGKGLGIFIGEEYRVRDMGQVTRGRKREIEFLLH